MGFVLVIVEDVRATVTRILHPLPVRTMTRDELKERIDALDAIVNRKYPKGYEHGYRRRSLA